MSASPGQKLPKFPTPASDSESVQMDTITLIPTEKIAAPEKKGFLNNIVTHVTTLFINDNDKVEISSPYNPVHLTHVGYNQDTGEFTGLPKEWLLLLQNAGISQQEQIAHPQAVIDIIGFYNDQQLELEDKKKPAIPQRPAHTLSVYSTDINKPIAPVKPPRLFLLIQAPLKNLHLQLLLNLQRNQLLQFHLLKLNFVLVQNQPLLWKKLSRNYPPSVIQKIQLNYTRI